MGADVAPDIVMSNRITDSWLQGQFIRVSCSKVNTRRSDQHNIIEGKKI